MATLTPEFTTPWTNIILCWKPVSFPRLTKFQPCNSVLHVCSTFSRGKESSLHPLRAIYSSRCSLAKARPTESAPLTENRTPRLSGSWQNFFSPVLFTNSKTELFSDSRISHLFFPYSQFSTILMMATLGKTCTCFPRRKYISSSLGSLFLF